MNDHDITCHQKKISNIRRKLTRRAGLLYAQGAVWRRESNPDFLIIGPSRSATDWMHRRLIPHPDIYLPKIKEIQFFDALNAEGDYLFNLDNPAHWRWYWMHFSNRKGCLTGDVTPDYSALPSDRVDEITRHLPYAKFIYCIRNPVERAWSGLRHGLWCGSGRLLHDVGNDQLAELVMNKRILDKGDPQEEYRKMGSQCWQGQTRLRLL